MRALFLQHDHVSPPGPVAEAFSRRGFDIVEAVVVPQESYLTPNVSFEHPDASQFFCVGADGRSMGCVG